MSEPLLYVSDLSVRYSERREVTTALRDVSFSLGKEIVTIIGPSGSGKSSLLHTLAGDYPPEQGNAATLGRTTQPPYPSDRTRPPAIRALPLEDSKREHPPASCTRQTYRLIRPARGDSHDSIAYRSLRPLPQRTKWRAMPACSPCACLHHEARSTSPRRSILCPRCSDGKSLSAALPRAVATLSYPHPCVTHSPVEATTLSERTLLIGGKPGTLLADHRGATASMLEEELRHLDEVL